MEASLTLILLVGVVVVVVVRGQRGGQLQAWPWPMGCADGWSQLLWVHLGCDYTASSSAGTEEAPVLRWGICNPLLKVES